MIVTARAVFTSPQSLEVQVLVDSQQMQEGEAEMFRAVEAYFTFVAVGKDKNIIPVPQLKVRSFSPHYVGFVFYITIQLIFKIN